VCKGVVQSLWKRVLLSGIAENMGVTCKFGIIDYSVSDDCGGCRDSAGKGGEERKVRKRKEQKKKWGVRKESGTKEG
jgi:hypothetical protein